VEYQVIRQPGCIAEIHVSFTPEDVSKYFSMAYDRLRNDARIPGFRPGKAPNVIIKKRVGEDAVRDTAWLQIAEKAVAKIIEELDLKVIDEPTLKDMEKGSEGLAEGEPYEMDIIATLEPEVELSETSGLKLVKPDAEVAEEELAKTLAELQETHVKVVDLERDTVEPGDLVKALVKTFVGDDDEPYQEASQEIVVGAGRYDPAVDEKMVGLAVGAEVEMQYTYPEAYSDAALAGQETTVKANIESVRGRELPALDDEFAKLVGAEYESLDDLKTKIREQIAAAHEEYAQRQLELQVLHQLMGHSAIDVPLSMVEQVARGGLEDFARDLAKDGLSLEMFKQIAGVTDEQLMGRQRALALESVRVHFLYDALAKALEIEPTEEDINAAVTDYAKESKVEESFVRQAALVQEDFTERMTERATRMMIMAKLIAAAEVETVSREEYSKREEEIFAHIHGPNCGHEEAESAPAEGECTEDHVHGPECGHPAAAEEPVSEEAAEEAAPAETDPEAGEAEADGEQ
jgi:trigger factor